MKIEKFLRALKEDDFGVGDSFWLGNWEFEVVGIRGPNRVAVDDDAAPARERTRRRFDVPYEWRTRDELECSALYRLVVGGAVGAGSGRGDREGSDSPLVDGFPRERVSGKMALRSGG